MPNYGTNYPLYINFVKENEPFKNETSIKEPIVQYLTNLSFGKKSTMDGLGFRVGLNQRLDQNINLDLSSCFSNLSNSMSVQTKVNTILNIQ